MLQFREASSQYKPDREVLMVPYGVDMSDHEWQVVGIVDSAKYGDVLGSLWQIGVMGANRVTALEGPYYTEYAKTIGERYAECGILPTGDERGLIENRSLQISSGVEVAISTRNRGNRLSVNSCVGILSVQTVKNPVVRWPLVESRGGEIREIGLTEQCVVLGNKSRRNAVSVPEKCAIDTVWIPNPLAVWEELIGALRDGYYYQHHGQSVEDGAIDADTYGFL